MLVTTSGHGARLTRLLASSVLADWEDPEEIERWDAAQQALA